MTSKLNYTRKEYESIYESYDKSVFDLDKLTNPRVISKQKGNGIVLQSSINKINNEVVHVVYVNDGDNINIYNNNDEMLSDISQYIKDGVKRELNKLPLVYNHIGNLIDYELNVLKNSFILSKKNIKTNIPLKEKSKRAIVSTTSKGISSLLAHIISNLPYLIDRFKDKDTLRHIKNFNINFNDLDKKLELKTEIINLTRHDSNGFLLNKSLDDHVKSRLNGISYNSIEKMDDSINEIVLIQKTKKLIQKTFSVKNRFLINDDTFNLVKELVMKEVDKSQFHDNFAKKMARYKDSKEFNSELRKYIQQSQGWSIEQYLDRAKNLDIDVIYNESNILALTIDTYDQSQKMGSKQWCISYDEHFFNQYHFRGKMCFLYDFNKEIDDNTSIFGLVIESNNKIYAGHCKDDTQLDESDKKMKEMMTDFYPAILELKSKDYATCVWNFASQIIDKKDKERIILKKFTQMELVDYMKYAISNNLVRNIGGNSMHDFLMLGYKLEGNKEHKDAWIKLSHDIFNNHDLLPLEEFNEKTIFLNSVLSSNDMKLMESFFVRLEFNDKPLKFVSNNYMWAVVNDVRNKNEKNGNIVLELLEKHKFKFSEEDICKIGQQLARAKQMVEKYKDGFSHSSEEYTSMVENVKKERNNLQEFHKVIKEYNLNPE